MATSGSYIFTVTRDDIIRDAMLNIGELEESETPSAQETTDCARRLNMLVKQWQGRSDFAPGLKVWMSVKAQLFLQQNQYRYALGLTTTDHWTKSGTQQPSTATSAAAATTVTVASISGISNADNVGVELDSGAVFWTTVNGAPSGTTITLISALTDQSSVGNAIYTYTSKATRPVDIQAISLRDLDFNDTPIGLMRDIAQYMVLPSKQNITYESDPGSVYYEAQLTNGILYLDVGSPANTNKWLYISYLEDSQDLTTALDNPAYPGEWNRALAWGLAKDIAPMFQAPWTDTHERNFSESLSMARESYAEVSAMYFQPNE